MRLRDAAIVTSPSVRPAVWFWATAALIVAAIAWTHGSVLAAGFRADDYFVIRPWTSDQIRHVLGGSWDPLGVQDPYHRPLTAFYQAAWFPLFGYNARAMHAVSLVELGLVALGLALVVSRELRQPAAGTLAAIIFIVHPMVPDSTSAWIFNQMSLLADLTVVAALLAWQWARVGRARRWLLVWSIAAVSVYIKEDGAMLVPAILTLQWWRARTTGHDARPSRGVVASGLAVLAVLLAIRVATYPTASPWPPTFAALPYYVHEWLSGPYHVLLRLPGDGVAGVPGNIGVVLALVSAALLTWRRPTWSPASGLLVSAAILLWWCGAPLLFISGPTRSHLITLSAALMVTGAAAVIMESATLARQRYVVIGAGVAILVSLSLASRAMNTHYAPCAPDTLHQDEIVRTWDVVAPELRAWLGEKRRACETGTYQPLPADFVAHPPR